LRYYQAGFFALVACLNVGGVSAVEPSTASLLDSIQREVELQNVDDASLKKLEKVLEIDYKNGRAHCLMGNCLDQLGLHEQAFEQLQLGVRYAPNDPHVLVELIKEYIKQKRIALARAMIEEAKRRFPNDHEIMFWLGNFYLSRGEVAEAMQQYREAYKSGDPLIGLPSAMAKIAFLKHDYEQALQYAEEDLHLNAKFLMANQIKGLALHHLGLYKDALPALRFSFDDDPREEEVAYAYAQSLYWIGDYAAALKVALVYLAMKANETEDDGKSERLVLDIIRRMPKAALVQVLKASPGVINAKVIGAYHLALAHVLDQSGLYDLAIGQYQTGLNLKANAGRGWYRLARDLELHTHDYDRALACYKKARLLSPENSQIKLSAMRLADRLRGRGDDLAWQLRDNLQKLSGLNP
jgi:tetratricopeptide (TPR) repeat protein